MNLSCLFTHTARQVYNKETETVFNYINAPSFKKFDLNDLEHYITRCARLCDNFRQLTVPEL